MIGVNQLDTKEKLLYSAMKSIKEDGINGFTIRNVSKLCGISSAAIYKHYKNKSDLLNATIEYILDAWYAEVESITSKPTADYPEIITSLALYTIEFLSKNELYLPVIVAEIYSDYNYISYNSKVSHYFRDVLSKWTIHKSISHEKATKMAFLLQSIIISSILSIYNSHYEFDEKTKLMVGSCIAALFENI